MRNRLFVFCLLIAALALGLDTKINNVTVYPDRATITRKAAISVSGGGEHEFMVYGIPSNIDASSIRLSGKGTKGMKFGGIQLKRDYAPIDSGRIADIEERLRIIEDELSALVQKRNALGLEREYLSGIGKLAAASTTDELKAGKVDPVAYDKTYQFLHESYMRIADMTVEFGIRERKLNEEKNRLNRERNDLGYNKDKGFIASFPVVSKTAGNATVEISYTIYNASWTPAYDVRYLSENGEIELTYYGIVRQRTGENWDNAEITLSTSRPSLGATYPRLNPWYLNIFQPMPSGGFGRGANARWAEESIAEDDFAAPAAPMLAKKAEYKIDAIQAEPIDVGGGSIQFKIPGKQTIPADNSSKKLTVSIEVFDAEESYVCVPKLAQRAYLSAEFENETDYPILPGQVALFNGNNYIGKTNIQYLAPGESVQLSLGVNEAIKVERTLMKDFASKSGVFGGKKRRAFAYQTTIENQTGRDIDIAVFEQLPVPQNEKIELDDVQIIPSVKEDDIERGMFSWKATMKSSEKKEFQVKFIVVHSKDIDISGL